MAQTQVKKIERPKQPKKDAGPETKPKEHITTDEIDSMLEEIDSVLEEVAGGQSSENAQDFVRAYVQKGGE